MLLSSGGFAVYRSETHVFNVLEAAYGNLGNRHNKKKLMKAWLGSKLFRLSELDAQEIEARVMADCRNGGDFLRIVMGDITRKQNVERWADCTPDHSLYVQRIKETIPDALIVHIIRDGRDVALSMDKQGWIRPLPGDRKEHLMVSSLYWEWVVNRGREAGRKLEGDYYEVHFEDLLQNPRSVLAGLGAFIEHDLNYDRILEVGIGSVREPNSSFQCGASGKDIAYYSLEGNAVDKSPGEEGGAAVRAETCEQCHGYRKILYQEKDTGVEPVADDVASVALDLLLAEEGYHRASGNPLLWLPNTI